MANGDVAAAQGFTPVPGTKDIRLGYDDINRLADWVASRTTGVRASAAGKVDITPAGSGDVFEGQIAITFPAGRFTSAPRVVATPMTQSSTGVYVGTADITASGCTIYLKRSSATLTSINWIAQVNG